MSDPQDAPRAQLASEVGAVFSEQRFESLLSGYGVSREDVALLNRTAFAAAAKGYVREARVIAEAVAAMAPDHAAPVITEYLCAKHEGRRAEALALLERDGLTKARAWEQAAELLLADLDPVSEADRRRPVEALLEKARAADSEAAAVESAS